MKPGTPEFDNTQAITEGWVISDCEGSDNGPWQLQRIDEDEIFDDDSEAWIFVYNKAQAGSAYHVSAFAYLAEHNPMEIEHITKWLASQEASHV